MLGGLEGALMLLVGLLSGKVGLLWRSLRKAVLPLELGDWRVHDVLGLQGAYV